MFLPNDDKRFLDLLQKWQDGDFTRVDEQELQALARGDDFRREALEGFFQHPEADHHRQLQALRARLQPEKAVRRVIFPQMWAVAAALALLVAALWFFRTPVPDTLDTIAQSEKPAGEPPTLSDATAPLPPPILQEQSEKSGATTSGSQYRQSAASGPAARPEEQNVALTENKDMAAAPQPAIQPAANTDVEDDVSKPDSEFALNEVAVQKQKEDVAATDMKAPEKKMAADKAPRSMPGQQAPANSVQDVDFARIALQDYLRRNARLPEAARQNNVSGFVEVSFRINKQQKAIDFEVLRSLGYGCDEAAISLLKAYNWRDFTQDSLTVEVPFVR